VRRTHSTLIQAELALDTTLVVPNTTAFIKFITTMAHNLGGACYFTL